MKIWKTGKNKEKLEDMKINVFLEQQKNDVRKSLSRRSGITGVAHFIVTGRSWDVNGQWDVEKRLGDIFTKKHGGLSGFALW